MPCADETTVAQTDLEEFASGGQVPHKPCEACGARLLLRRWSNGVLETRSQFSRRRFCDKDCQHQGLAKYSGASADCSVADCDKDAITRGWCSKHYSRWRTHGDPLVGTYECKDCGERFRQDIDGEQQRVCDACVGAGRPHLDRGECRVGSCGREADGSRGYCAAHYHRWQRHGDPLASAPFRRREVERTCKYCGDVFMGRSDAEFCCANHWRRFRLGRPLRKTCAHCGDEFRYDSPSNTCSAECRAARREDYKRNWIEQQREENPGFLQRRAAAERRRRARKQNGRVEEYHARDIYERDGWRCQLCGDPVKKGADWREPKAPVIDHIVPISRGGDDIRRNVQCAHRACNSEKGAGAMGSQLLLIG